MHRIAGELYQTEYQNMRENVSPKNAKNAPWLQIAEYLIFCTRDDKDVHNALLTARKMEITNTNTQKYTFFIFYILYTVLAMRKLDFSLWIISNRPLPHYVQKVFFPE